MKIPEHIREIHAIRAAIARQYGYDLKKYFEHLKEVEKNRKNLVHKAPARK